MTETLSYLLKNRIHVKERIRNSRGEEKISLKEYLKEINHKIKQAKQRRANDTR